MSKLKAWAKKTGRTVEELTKELEAKIDEVRKLNPNLPDAEVVKRARFLLYRELKSEIISPAIWFEGVILGYSEAWDITEPLKRQIQAEYELNPEKVIQEGKVKVDSAGNIVYIDTRPTLPDGRPNPWYGKPIQPVIVRNLVGVVRPLNGEFKLTVITAMLDQANNLPPLGKPVKFRALVRDDSGKLRVLRTSRVTKYIPTEIEEFKDVTPLDLLRSAPDDFKCPLKELLDFFDQHANERYRIAIVEGDVLNISEEPTSRGNKLMLLEDDTFDLDDQPVPVWIHRDILHLVDFGPGSRVAVIGQVITMPGYDFQTRQQTDQPRAAINAFGVYADPTLKMPPSLEDVEVE